MQPFAVLWVHGCGTRVCLPSGVIFNAGFDFNGVFERSKWVKPMILGGWHMKVRIFLGTKRTGRT